MRNLFFITLFIFSTSLSAKELKLRWFGTTFFILESENEAILFDPFITRPGISSLLLFDELKPNIEEYKKWVPDSLQKKIQAVFISHSHYDHILDLESAMKENEAVVYGDESTKIVAKKIGIEDHRIGKAILNKPISVGHFKVTPLSGKHPSHLLGMTLADGKIKDFKYPSSAYGYRMGEVFTFLIEFGDYKIFFAASGVPVWKKSYNKVDVLIQGIANGKHYEELIKDQVLPSKAKMLIPAHYDNFFTNLKNPPEELITSDLKEFFTLLKKAHGPATLMPKYGDEIILLKN